ncbi:MAG: adenylate/guanylate cyclase domain-containing protein [Nitrospirota bacterium]|nr:MAG: adenylate/guanylate cyclase domain-containing protein [Nitrospirota bacterium]
MLFNNKLKLITIFSLCSTLLFAFILLLSPPIIDETIESLFTDFRFRVRNLINRPEVPQDIVIVEIDDRTLERYGSWPLKRTTQAEIIERIMHGRPKVLTVDIFYAENQSVGSDEKLRNVFKKYSGKIVLATGFERENSDNISPPEFLWDHALMDIKHSSGINIVWEAAKIKISDEALYSHAIIGHVLSLADIDGKLRREYMFIKYGDDYFPSLSLITAAHGLGMSIEDIVIHGGRGVALGDIFIPTDPEGRFRINYLGENRTFSYISASDVLDEMFDPALFADKTVLLGASALQTYDPVVTPFSARMPGVEKNATVIENITSKRFIRNIPLSVTLLLIVLSGVFLAFVLPGLRAVPGLIVSTTVVVALIMANQMIFSYYERYLNFVYPFINLMVITIFSVAYKYTSEERKARELKRIFSSYVSPKIVNELINNPEMARLGGSRKEVTILFSDIRGFTSFSEKREPEEVVEILNEYFKEMTDVIFRWDGTLDKFVGDEIMAFWGAPIDQPDHAELAVRCALNMSNKLDELREKWRSEDKPLLDCGIGINTGSVLIGNIGAADKKMDYTAIGDHVNLGARVEALTRDYDTRILITEHTYNKISDSTKFDQFGHIELIEGESVKVKGKETAVKIYKVRLLPH